MATSLTTIKNWFKTGLKPTQAQFWAVFDSFRHKDDGVPAGDVSGLQDLLDGKMDKKAITATIKAGTYVPGQAYVYDALIPEYVSFSNPNSASPDFQAEGWYRLTANATGVQTPDTNPEIWKYNGRTLGDVTIDDVFGLTEVISSKVDKVEGYGLSQNNYSTEEKNKLAQLQAHNRGTYVSLAELITAIPAGNAGDEAVIDAGSGSEAKKAIWDTTDTTWVIAGGGTIVTDAVPTDGSLNAVQSGGVKTELDKKLETVAVTGDFTGDGKSASKLAITETWTVESTSDYAVITRPYAFKIESVTAESGLTVSLKNYSDDSLYTTNTNLAAFAKVKASGDVIGKSFTLNVRPV